MVVYLLDNILFSVDHFTLLGDNDVVTLIQFLQMLQFCTSQYLPPIEIIDIYYGFLFWLYNILRSRDSLELGHWQR